MKRLSGCAALALTLAIAMPAQAQQCARPAPTDRPKIGLVLGGGGARGAAHIGVIRYLEEMHVPIDYVAGTSMGSLVGAFYATGMNAQQLEETVEAIDFETLFTDSTARKDLPYISKQADNLGLFGPEVGIGRNSQLLPLGAVHGQKISFLFERLTSERVQQTNFDDLPIPYRAVATDIVTGDAVVMDQGSLAVAMRASMSVPGAFDPVPLGQALLVDGGLADNVPIDVIRRMGADIVIAVNVGTPLEPRENLTSLVSITAQLSGLLVVRNAAAQIATLKGRDVLISPALGDDITSASFDKVAEAIPIGYAAAAQQRTALETLAIAAPAYASQRSFIESCVATPKPVQFVRIDNRSRFEDAVIQERLHIPLGQPLDPRALDKDIEQIYALGYLNLVRYEVVDVNGESGVIVHVTQDSRGTRFLEWGFDVFSSGDSTEANLRLAVLNTAIDDLGSQTRVMLQLGETPLFLAEMKKAISPPLNLYLVPRIFAERRDLSTFNASGNTLNTYQVDQYGGELDIMRTFGNDAALSAGIQRFDGHGDVLVGPPNLPNYSYTGAEYLFEASLDSLDDRYFPSRGGLASFVYRRSASPLGADDSYQQFTSVAIGAMSSGRHTVFAGFKYDMTFDNNAPIYALFRGGGLFNLSGLEPNEVNGQNFGEVLASYRFDLTNPKGLLPAYIGVAAEFGNAGEQHRDPFSDGIMNGTLYFGNRSPIGPLYWGVGFAEGGKQVYFLRIGNVFGRSTIGR